jgi:hypothetical protein
MNDDSQKWELERDRYQIEQIKIVLTLSSGTLIVTLGFLVSKIQFVYKGVLYLSWIFIINSIIFGIWAITGGMQRYDRAVKGRKGKLEGKEKELYEKGNVLFPLEAKTPNIQIWSFTIGLFDFFIFVLLNVHNTMKW